MPGLGPIEGVKQNEEPEDEAAMNEMTKQTNQPKIRKNLSNQIN